MDWYVLMSFLMNDGSPVTYTSAGMESEPGALPLDSLLIAIFTSAWKLLIGTRVRWAIAFSLMTDGQLRTL